MNVKTVWRVFRVEWDTLGWPLSTYTSGTGWEESRRRASLAERVRRFFWRDCL